MSPKARTAHDRWVQLKWACSPHEGRPRVGGLEGRGRRKEPRHVPPAAAAIFPQALKLGISVRAKKT